MTNQQLLFYIQLIVNKLIHLGGCDEEKDKRVSKEESSKGFIQRDFGIEDWDWPQGIGLYGLHKLQEFYGDNRFMDFFNQWYKNNIERGLPSKNINTTAPYLTLVNLTDLFETDGVYRKLCIERAEWLMNELERTKENGFQHVTSAVGCRNDVSLNDGELWVDTLVMAVLFLNKMGIACNRDEWRQEAVRQFLIHIKYLYDKQKKLFYHGWSFERNDNFGGIFWCRGNAWFAYGAIDFLEICGSRLEAGVFSYLADTFKAQVEALVLLQSPSGLWHTVLDDDSSYEEVSGSAAIAAGIMKGIKSGILDSSYQNYADRAIEAICNHIAEDGTVLSVSAGTGVGLDSQHYKNIACLPMAYGQSLALIALYEALK